MLRGRAYGKHSPERLPAGALMAVGFGSGHEYLEQMRAHEAGTCCRNLLAWNNTWTAASCCWLKTMQ